MTLRSILFGLFVLLLLAGVYVDSRAREEVGDHRWRFKNESRVAADACGTVEYGVGGSGDPVLVLHDAAGGFDQGLDAARILGERGFTLLAPSRFGHLRSPAPQAPVPPSAAAQADAYACLLDQLQLAPRMPVVALGTGAASAVEFCARHAQQCSALVLVAPVFAGPGGPPAGSTAAASGGRIVEAALADDRALWLAARVVPAELIETLLGTPPTDYARATPDEQQRVRDALRGLMPVRERAPGLRLDAQAATLDPAALRRLQVPVLVVSAADDRHGAAAMARSTAAAVPGARLVEYPDGGHLLVGRLHEAWTAVEEFLRGLPAPAG